MDEIAVAAPWPAASGVVPQSPTKGCNYEGAVAIASAAGVVNIRIGSATGQIIDHFAFAAAGFDRSYIDDVFCDSQIYVELVSGTMPTGGIFFE